MPRSNREWAQRKINNAIGCLDKAAAHLQEVADLYYKEGVDRVSDNCLIIVTALAEIPEHYSRLVEKLPSEVTIPNLTYINDWQKLIDALKVSIEALVEGISKLPKPAITIEVIEAKQLAGEIIKALYDLRSSF